MNSLLGAVKGGQEGEGAPVPENADPTQSELGTDAGEQSFENVPVSEDGENLTRYISIWGRCDTRHYTTDDLKFLYVLSLFIHRIKSNQGCWRIFKRAIES